LRLFYRNNLSVFVALGHQLLVHFNGFAPVAEVEVVWLGKFFKL
jgi:hypothetical protein